MVCKRHQMLICWYCSYCTRRITGRLSPPQVSTIPRAGCWHHLSLRMTSSVCTSCSMLSRFVCT